MKKMSESYVCCEQCFEAIGKRNTRAARLWLEMIDLFEISGGNFGIRADDFPEMTLLEKLGYILTTDRRGHLMIRLHGLNNYTFCIGDHNEIKSM